MLRLRSAYIVPIVLYLNYPCLSFANSLDYCTFSIVPIPRLAWHPPLLIFKPYYKTIFTIQDATNYSLLLNDYLQHSTQLFITSKYKTIYSNFSSNEILEFFALYLPSHFGDDHFCSSLMELLPEALLLKFNPHLLRKPGCGRGSAETFHLIAVPW